MQIKHCRSHKLSYKLYEPFISCYISFLCHDETARTGQMQGHWNPGDKMVWLLGTISHLCMLESLDWYVRL